MIRTYVTSPEVTRFLTWEPYTDEAAILAYLDRMQNQNAFPNETLIVTRDEFPIGTVHILEREPGVAQFGYGILPAYWGQGIGTALVGTVLSYLETSSWNQLTRKAVVGLHQDNVRAQATLLAHGFQLHTKLYEPNRHLYALDRPFRTTTPA